MSSEADRDPYASAVISILAGDFPDLRNEITAEIVRKHIYAYTHDTGHGGCEIIIDNPATANWRLVANRDDSGRVSLACWRYHPTEADYQRLDRLNAALDALEGPQ